MQVTLPDAPEAAPPVEAEADRIRRHGMPEVRSTGSWLALQLRDNFRGDPAGLFQLAGHQTDGAYERVAAASMYARSRGAASGILRPASTAWQAAFESRSPSPSVPMLMYGPVAIAMPHHGIAAAGSSSAALRKERSAS